jgi:8-oxo-dGTP diphosphatase
MPMSDHIANLRAKVGHDLLMSPGVAAIILDESGKILLQRRSDNGRWGLPGGAIDPGEEPAEAVVREVREETGLHVVPVRVVGVYGGPDLHVQYPNGDEVMVISIAFLCRVIGGRLQIDQDESLELKYFSLDNLPQPFLGQHTTRILHATQDRAEAAFRFNGEYYPR